MKKVIYKILLAFLLILSAQSILAFQPGPSFPLTFTNVSHNDNKQTLFSWVLGNNTANQCEDQINRSIASNWTQFNSPTVEPNCAPFAKPCLRIAGGATQDVCSKTDGLAPFYNSTDQLTIMMWVNFTAVGTPTYRWVLGHEQDDPPGYFAIRTHASDFSITVGSGNPALTCSGETVIDLNQWYHWAFVINETGTTREVTCYINGTLAGSGTYTNKMTDYTGRWNIGARISSGADGAAFEITDLRMYNQSLNATQINSSYFGIFGNQPTAAPPPAVPPNSTIQMKNIVNNTILTTFNITIYNTTKTLTYISTNDTAILNETGPGIYNISISTLNHYDRYVIDYNITESSANTFQVGQGKINITQYFVVTRSIVRNFTIINNLFSNYSGTVGNDDDVDMFMNFGINTFNITGMNFSSYVVNYSYLGNITNTSISYNVTNKRFKFNITDYFTGSPLNNFVLTIMNSTWSYNNLVSTSGAELIFDAENISFIVQVNKTNYTSVNYSINTQANNSNTTFVLYRTNTVNVSVKYEPTRLPILNGTLVNVFLIGQSFSTNQTIYNTTLQGNTSFLFVDVTSGEYEIRYVGDGFQERSKYVIVTSDGYVSTDLFLLDAENSTEITFNVIDQYGKVLPNATLKALRYYNDFGGGLGNGFIEVEATRTNFVGQAVMHLQRPNVFYKFLVEYNGDTIYESGATELISTSYSFQVSTTGSILDSYKALNTDLWGNITFVNSSSPNFFRGTFSSPTGLLRYACLKVEKKTFSGNVLINESCLSASSGSIIIHINESDESEYVAQLYVDTSYAHSSLPIATLWVSLQQSFKTFGTQGLLYAFVFIGILATVGAFNPVTGIIMALLGLIITYFAGLTFFTGTIIFFLIGSGIIVASRMKS